MAISLVSVVNKESQLKLVSVKDSAIDWEKSYADVEKTEEDESLEEAKKKDPDLEIVGK